MLGLLSLPFLVFQIPVVKDALTHTKKTGYDRGGKCVAVLNKAEKANRYAVMQEARKLRYEEMMNGGRVGLGEWIELKWNAWLGFPELDRKKVKHAKKKTGQTDSVKDKTLNVAKKVNPVNLAKRAANGNGKEMV